MQYPVALSIQQKKALLQLSDNQVSFSERHCVYAGE